MQSLGMLVDNLHDITARYRYFGLRYSIWVVNFVCESYHY